MGILFTRFLELVFLIAAPTYACAHVEINIYVGSQTMTVHSGSGETFVWPISSGKAGHATPNGVFRPRALYAMVHSAKYGNAAMPHTLFSPRSKGSPGPTGMGHPRPPPGARLRRHSARQCSDFVRNGAEAGGGN